jgi:lipopolysaccharide transport protein LptA
MVLLSGIPMAVAALDESADPEVGTNSQPLNWWADDAVLDFKKSLLVLTGNVKIVQGKTMIIADKVQMFFIGNASTEQTLKADSVKKLEANGNVRIEFEMGVATSESALYSPETKILVLSGTPAKFVGGEDTITGTITGSKITVNRETGTISVKKSEAVIFPEDDL